MHRTIIFFLILSSVFLKSYSQESRVPAISLQESNMSYTLEKQKEKLFIGLALRTSNATCSLEMPAHKNRFFQENIPAIIPNKINDDILAVYTDYEGDYTKPYSWILGCEVSSFDEIPPGLTGVVIPASQYAVFKTEGAFPEGLIAAWQKIWQANLARLYTSDFEIYSSDFHPETNPRVQVYIAIEEEESPMLHAVLQGRFDAMRVNAIYSPLPNAGFKETEHNIFYAWGIDYATANGVLEKDNYRIPTEKEIAQAITYFSDRQLPFIWWTGAKILETKGFQSGGMLTGIAIDISQGTPVRIALYTGIEIKKVSTEAELVIFTDLLTSVFGMNATAKEQFLALNRALLQQGEQVHFLAYLEGKPVGTASLSVSPSSASIWNVATAPEQRKKGVGNALVYEALIEAKKREYNEVSSILLPKGMAWNLFTNLGFKEVCKFPFYLYGVSSEELEK